MSLFCGFTYCSAALAQAPLSSDELQRLLHQLDSSGLGVVKIKDLYDMSRLSDQEIVRRARKAAEDLLAKQTAAAMQVSEEEKGRKGGKNGKGKLQKMESKTEVAAGRIVQCSRCGIPLCEPSQETKPR